MYAASFRFNLMTMHFKGVKPKSIDPVQELIVFCERKTIMQLVVRVKCVHQLQNFFPLDVRDFL